MKKYISTFVLLLVMSTPFLSQSESKVIADAKKHFSEFSSYKFNDKWNLTKGFVPYTQFSLVVTKNAGFKCNPNAKIQTKIFLEYWSNQSSKDRKYSNAPYTYLGMPKPNYGKLLELVKKNDPLNLLSSSELFTITEFHSVDIPADAKYDFRGENKVRIKGKLVISQIRTYTTVQKRELNVELVFERETCGAPFKFINSGIGSSKILEEKEYSASEMKELELHTIGRERAEAKAKEEWAALSKIEIPKYKNFHEMAYFFHEIFMTGTKEEVKSLLYHTQPSSSFVEGSDYLMYPGTGEDIQSNLDMIFREKNSYRTRFCSYFVKKHNLDNEYSYYTKDKKGFTQLIGELEKGKWVLSKLNLHFDDDMEDVDCPQPPVLEKLADEDFGFSIMMPKGYKKELIGDAVMYQVKIDEGRYVVIANKLGPPTNPNDRINEAKRSIKSRLYTYTFYDEIKSDWNYNGQEGKEVIFTARHKRGGSSIFKVQCKIVWLGDILYEFYIQNMDFSPYNEEFMKSFTSTLSSEDTFIEYKVGDYVLVGIGAGRWEKGVIDEINGDKYDVICKHLNKIYTTTVEGLKMRDKPAETSSSSNNTSTTSSSGNQTNTSSAPATKVDKKKEYEIGDYVLIYLGNDKWEKGRVTERISYDSYKILCYNIQQIFRGKVGSMKVDHEPNEKKKGEDKNSSKKEGMKNKLNGLKNKLN